MKQLSEFLYELIPMLLFCVAVTLLFIHFKSLSASYQCMNTLITGNEILYESSNSLNKQNLGNDANVSKKELLITLVSGLDYDIVLEGVCYEKDTFDYETFDFASLADSFEKSYQYDKDGKIKAICYTKEAIKE